MRFFAFAAVFLHHMLPRSVAQEQSGIVLGSLGPETKFALAGAANALGFGLPLFFTLSAYLIGTLLLREKERFGTIDLRSFYVRRVLRIWPLYFFGLGIGGVIALFIEKQPRDLMLFAGFAVLAGNWVAMVWHTSNPVLPLWSISVEEQFYLFCPITVKLLSRRGMYVFSIFLIVLSDLVLWVMGSRHADVDRTIWYNSFVQFQMFGGGLLLSLLMNGRSPNIRGWVRPFLLASGYGCWLLACFVYGAKQIGPAVSGFDMVAGYGVACAGCVLVIVGMLGIDQRWLPRPLIWLGRVSFGLYVYHEIAVKIAFSLFRSFHGYEHFILTVVGGGILTVIFAALSYRFLELPFLRMKQRFEVVPSRPA
ncbi:MAG TPA: acyltransferase [Acidobacteriaceae bacterium]|nr:acyltransferase [Acidobacteriaceae bacterium]